MTLNTNHKLIIGATAVLLAPVILLLSSPNIEQEQTWCPFLRYFHLPCPGCGLTKSMVAAYRGDFLTSLSWHPFGLVLIVMSALVLILCAHDQLRHTTWADRFLNHRLLWPVFGATLAATYIIKLVTFFCS